MAQNFEAPQQKFKTPEEEIAHLRSKLSQIEQEEKPRAPEEEKSRAHELVRSYAQTKPEEVLHEDMHDTEAVFDVDLDLPPEEHDKRIAEFYSLMQEKGVRNAISAIEKLGNSHLEDDFHRFVAEFLREGFKPEGLKEKSSLWRALGMTLFELTLPDFQEEHKQRDLAELLSRMEQFYAGTMSIVEKGKRNYFTLELAVEAHQEHVTLFMAVPNGKEDLFEKQLLSIFPDAHFTRHIDDYNIFAYEGKVAGSIAEFKREPSYPLKTYEDFGHDPLNVLLSAFSKLAKNGEGAALQIVVEPREDFYNKKFQDGLKELKKGTKAKKALDIPLDISDHVVKGVKDLVSIGLGSSKKKDDDMKPPEVDDTAVEQVGKKLDSRIIGTNIRLLTSAKDEARSRTILSDLEASFEQFTNSQGNALTFEQQKSQSSLKRLVRQFSFRLPGGELLPMNLRELATLYHAPLADVSSSRELKRTKAGTAPAPLELPDEGVVLGVNDHRGTETLVRMAPKDRLRHTYVIGQTGTGKTNLLKNMIIQDIEAGEGVCFMDPHGSDVQDILAAVPKERADDVIYFDPSHTERPMGLNMLEYDRRFPEQKTFVVDELFGIFKKLYGSVPESMGPIFEQYFRNSTMLVIEDPDTGNTLLDVSRVLADEEYRKLKLKNCNNPVIVQFWEDVAQKAGGEAALANIVPYITSKFDVFLANEIMRPIVAQSESAFNFRKAMDEKKILLVNLAKGRLGDINSNLLGLIIVGKILMAALSRVDSLDKNIPPFYLYIDEFQNFVTDSITTILSEARKYKLGLHIAHQFIEQIDEGIRDAVFGNVGTMAAFRVGIEDSEYLKEQFAPTFTPHDLANLDNFNAYMRLLVHGRPVKPFSLATLPPKEIDAQYAETLKKLSYMSYGVPRAEIEADINERYKKYKHAENTFE